MIGAGESKKVGRTMKALYGHVSETSAFMCDDYPYGRKVRCRIRYWLESDPKKGFRFCSQTENPRTLQWNNPKKSTYSLLAGCMYLTEEGDWSEGNPVDVGHVKWSGLSEYDGPIEVYAFIRSFPLADLSRLKRWCRQKGEYCRAWAEGKGRWTINGVAQETTEADIERHREEMAQWFGLCRELGVMKEETDAV